MNKYIVATSALLLATASFGADGSTGLARSYGYMPGASIVLGQGFSIENPLSSPAPCMQDVKKYPDANKSINQNATVNVSVVTSNSALKAALGIDTQMDASMLAYSGSGSLDFNSEVDVSHNDATVVIQGDVEYGSDLMDLAHASYPASVQKLIDRGDLTSFHQLCGNSLITGIKYGSKISVVISIKGLSNQEKVTINSSASVSGGFGPLSGSAKSKINSMLSSSSSSTEIKMQAFVRGGEGLPNLDALVGSLLTQGLTLDQMKPSIQRIFKSLSPDKAAVIGFTTQPYPGVSDIGANLMTLFKIQKLALLTENFRYQNSRYTRISGDLNQMEMTGSTPEELQTVSPSLVESSRLELTRLNDYVQKLATVHDDCLKDDTLQLTKCVFPDRPATPNIDVLYNIINM